MVYTSMRKAFSDLREKRPLVHHITNYVTVNDCANITLCMGASPVMADALSEMKEMTSLASALVLNIGTVNERIMESIMVAGSVAKKEGIPIIFDPVGAGATSYRTAVSKLIIDKISPDVIKGNAGEISILAGTGGVVKGVDSKESAKNMVETCRSLARKTGAIVVASGKEDIITDGAAAYAVANGHEWMDRLSGTGCMLSSVTASFCAVSPDTLIGAVAAAAAFGLAGEQAAADKTFGPYSFRTKLFDKASALTPEDLEAGAKVVRL